MIFGRFDFSDSLHPLTIPNFFFIFFYVWIKDGLGQKFLPRNEPNESPRKDQEAQLSPLPPKLKFLYLFLNARNSPSCIFGGETVLVWRPGGGGVVKNFFF